MNREEAYKIWAPMESVWSPWVKPVLFAQGQSVSPAPLSSKPYVDWAPPANNTAIILNLPEQDSVIVGVYLAEKGYRPIPLFNGIGAKNNARTLVDVKQIIYSLMWGAHELNQVELAPNAPPVFLLDSNRLNASLKEPGAFDNRWCVFPQDMPSAEFLKENGIQNILLYSVGTENDLDHILYRYYKNGLSIYNLDHNQKMQPANIHQPHNFKNFFYRAGVLIGLRKNAAGGFGAYIPEQTSSSGRRYHSYG